MEAQLSGSHQKTYDRVFQHPMPHNLQWREVWSMLGSIPDAKAVEEVNGNLKVSRNGQNLVLHRPRGKDLADKKELMQVRHFLERSGRVTAGSGGPRRPRRALHLPASSLDHRESREFTVWSC